jgi:hypothetical protein
MSEQESTIPISESSDRRRLFVGLGILAGVVLVIVLVVVILLFIDPFGWDLLGTAQKDVAAEAIPTEVAMYFHLNLDRLDDENLEAIVRALSPEPLEEGTTFLNQQLEELDAWLSEEMNITYSGDIQPWIGNDIGLGVSGLAFDLYDTAGQEGILFTIEVDDKSAADQFLGQVIAELEERSGATVEEETYADQTIYFLEDDVVSNIAICRSGDLMLIGETAASIQHGIDAQNGESLADLDSYQDAIGGLPGGEIVTIYMDMAKYYESMTPLVSMVYGSGMSDLMSESSSVGAYAAVGISAVDVGVKFDYAILTDPELQAEISEGYFYTDPKIASLAPEDTIMYFVSGIKVEDLEQTRETLLQLLSSQGTDAEEALALFTMAFGFDPIDDLIGSLDGEIALLLMPSVEGVLAESMDVPLGFALLAETNKPQKLLNVADDFSAAMERQGIGEAEVSEQEFGTIYDLVDLYSGDLIVTYGVGEEHLMIGSSSSVLADVFSGGPSLDESEAYQDIWDAFPRDMAPVMYLNIEGLIGQIRESMEPWEREVFDEQAGAVIEAMKVFAAAAAPMEDNLSKVTIILFIETE